RAYTHRVSSDLIIFIVVMGSVAALMAVILLVALRQGGRQRRARLEALAHEMGAGGLEDATALGYRAPIPTFEGEREGGRVRIFWRGGSRYPSAGFQWRTAPLPLVVFRKETWRDRVGRWIFLNREVQTGDDGFDRAVYIETDEPRDVVQELLARDA